MPLRRRLCWRSLTNWIVIVLMTACRLYDTSGFKGTASFTGKPGWKAFDC